MPFFSNSMTLLDYAKASNQPIELGIAMSLLGDFSVLEDLPLVTNPNLQIKGGRITQADLPTTQWGKINQDPVSIKTTTRQYEENAAIISEIVRIDRRLLAQKNWIEDPIQIQMDGATEAKRYATNDAFFNNDPSDAVNGNPDAWFGVRPRLRNPALSGVETNLRIDALGVDMSESGMTAATARAFMVKLSQALALLGATDGSNCVAYMNWFMKIQFENAIRILSPGGQGFKTTEDDFGRQISMWRNMKIKDCGFKQDGTSLILPYTDTATGLPGSSNYTSIVIVRYGGKYLKGWQTKPFRPEYLGRSTEFGVYENVLLDWACGIAYPNTRSFAEVYDILLNAP